MVITKDDIVRGYREILAAPAPDEATSQELMRTYKSLSAFRRRLRESAECQQILFASGALRAHQKH